MDRSLAWGGGVNTLGDPRNIVVDGCPDSPTNSMRLSPNYSAHMFFVVLSHHRYE